MGSAFTVTFTGYLVTLTHPVEVLLDCAKYCPVVRTVVPARAVPPVETEYQSVTEPDGGVEARDETVAPAQKLCATGKDGLGTTA